MDAPNGAAALELTDLRRTFGDLVALDGLSFSVAPGTLFGFVGRNGAGKTTAMRVVCGLLAADSGAVTWRGMPIDARARERIGYMPEERGLYPKMQARDQLESSASCTASRTPERARRPPNGSSDSGWPTVPARA